MTLKERLNLAARGEIITITTPWASVTNTRDFLLSHFEEIFLKLKVVREFKSDDGRTVLITEEKQ